MIETKMIKIKIDKRIYDRKVKNDALWSGTNKNRNIDTWPLARLFPHSLAPLTHSLAPDCSLRSRPPLRSLVRSLAHFAHSLARGTVNGWMAILSVFFPVFDHSASCFRRDGEHSRCFHGSSSFSRGNDVTKCHAVLIFIR